MKNQTNHLLTVAENVRKYAPQRNTSTTTTASTSTKADTTARLADLMQDRNICLELIADFDGLPPYSRLVAEQREKLEKTIAELCKTIAQIAVYKTLDRLSDSPKDITTSGAEMCEKLRKTFSEDMRIYRTKDTTANYSDAFDLFNVAYVAIWEYLNTTAPLTLEDVVLTVVNKSGTEKNYTIFQVACKSIREHIHSWSKSDTFKKLHYIIGIADNGDLVTSSKRPQDELTDIDQSTKAEFFNRYGLTAREQDIISLYIKGETTETIAELLNLNLRMVQRDIKTAKAKFKTANAYAEYITATNAEKLARAKAEKNPTDSIYQRAYTASQERTAKAYAEWKKAFKAENKNR